MPLVYKSADECVGERGFPKSSSPQFIIALRGAKNTGKSWTLNLLVDNLKRKVFETSFQGGVLGEGTLPCNKETGTVDRWLCVAVYGFVVLVYTAGDNRHCIHAAFSLATAYCCDALILPTRTGNSDALGTLRMEASIRGSPIVEIDRKAGEDNYSKSAKKQSEELEAELRVLCNCKEGKD